MALSVDLFGRYANCREAGREVEILLTSLTKHFITTGGKGSGPVVI